MRIVVDNVVFFDIRCRWRYKRVMANQRKNNGPMLVDQFFAELGGARTQKLLDRLDRLIPWEQLAGPIEALYRNDAGRGGRPNVPVVMMLKCILLQKWFNLSDPGLEEAIDDRISFRRFLGLATTDDGVDETTLVKFRKRLRDAGVMAQLFDTATDYLTRQGLILQQGTMVDATIIEAPKGRTTKDGLGSTKDKTASFTKKHGRTYHGYKAHIATDGNGMIKDFIFDTAKVHDSKHIDALIEGETQEVFADSAYMNQQRKQDLESRGVFCGIIERRGRGQAQLTGAQKAHNRLCATFRAAVEHPFAWIKAMGHRRVRYRGARRNAEDFGFMAMAYNFKRSLSLLT